MAAAAGGVPQGRRKQAIRFGGMTAFAEAAAEEEEEELPIARETGTILAVMDCSKCSCA